MPGVMNICVVNGSYKDKLKNIIYSHVRIWMRKSEWESPLNVWIALQFGWFQILLFIYE